MGKVDESFKQYLFCFLHSHEIPKLINTHTNMHKLEEQ